MYFGRGELILKERERLKKMAILNRRNEYQKSSSNSISNFQLPGTLRGLNKLPFVDGLYNFATNFQTFKFVFVIINWAGNHQFIDFSVFDKLI